MQAAHERRYIWPLVIAGILLLLTLLTRSALLLLLAVLFGLTAGLSLVWGRYALSRIEYQRSFDRIRCFAGESVKLTVALTNRKILPVTYLTVDDTMPEELQIEARQLRYLRIGKGTLRLLFGLSWYQKVIRSYTVKATRRGFYRLGPAVLEGGDPFGFVTRQQVLEEMTSLIVYPRVLPLEQVGLPTRRPFGDLRSRDRLFEDPLRFGGVREYQQGDPFNRVHWKATAAAGTLQVRLHDPSSNPGLAIFLNTWGFEHGWQGFKPEVLETGCVVAASIANWASEAGIPAGVYANGLTTDWGLNLRLPPARGAEALPRILEGLARIHSPAREPLSALLAEEAPRLAYGTSVVVVTDQLPDDLAAAVLRVTRSGRPVTLIQTGLEGAELPALPGVRIYVVPGEEALHASALA